MDSTRKYSKKRDAILGAIRATKEHPTAEYIYRMLKPDIPDLSLGTIYRNLALFRQTGEVVSVGTVNGQERFDGNTAPHSHFVCTICGSVSDIFCPFPAEDMYSAINTENGCHIVWHMLTFFGVCHDCRNP